MLTEPGLAVEGLRRVITCAIANGGHREIEEAVERLASANTVQLLAPISLTSPLVVGHYIGI